MEASKDVPPPRSSSKRSRAAEFHNLSEKVLYLNFSPSFLREIFWFRGSYWWFWCVQRRRSKINEKMKALQNLIPNSNKVLYLYIYSQYFSSSLSYFYLTKDSLFCFWNYFLVVSSLCLFSTDRQSFNARWGHRIFKAASASSASEFSFVQLVMLSNHSFDMSSVIYMTHVSFVLFI